MWLQKLFFLYIIRPGCSWCCCCRGFHIHVCTTGISPYCQTAGGILRCLMKQVYLPCRQCGVQKTIKPCDMLWKDCCHLLAYCSFHGLTVRRRWLKSAQWNQQLLKVTLWCSDKYTNTCMKWAKREMAQIHTFSILASVWLTGNQNNMKLRANLKPQEMTSHCALCLFPWAMPVGIGEEMWAKRSWCGGWLRHMKIGESNVLCDGTLTLSSSFMELFQSGGARGMPGREGRGLDQSFGILLESDIEFTVRISSTLKPVWVQALSTQCRCKKMIVIWLAVHCFKVV